jgi:TPP-dependent pyruvate/acetoin dehydrogenase alpha subunit
VAEWERRDPLARFRTWLHGTGALADGEEERWTEEINAEIEAAIQEAESLPPPPIESMFTDVYKAMPRHLAEQMRHAVALGEGTKFEGVFPL